MLFWHNILMSKYIKYRSGLGQLLPNTPNVNTYAADPSKPATTSSGVPYYLQAPEDNSTLNSVLGSVTSILGSVGTAFATGYAAKISADAQKNQIKAMLAAAAGQQQQPVIIQQSSNSGLWVALGLGGVVIIGGILFIALKK